MVAGMVRSGSRMLVGSTTRDGERNHHFVDGLPLGGSQGQAGLAHGAGTTAQRVFRYGDDGRQSHDGQYQTSGQTGFTDRQVEGLLQERHDDSQTEETVDHGRNSVQQFDDGLHVFPHVGTRYLGQVDGHRHSERKGYQDGKEAHP